MVRGWWSAIVLSFAVVRRWWSAIVLSIAVVRGWWSAIVSSFAVVRGWWSAIVFSFAVVRGWWSAIIVLSCWWSILHEFFRRTLSRSFREKQSTHNETQKLQRHTTKMHASSQLRKGITPNQLHQYPMLTKNKKQFVTNNFIAT